MVTEDVEHKLFVQVQSVPLRMRSMRASHGAVENKSRGMILTFTFPLSTLQILYKSKNALSIHFCQGNISFGLVNVVHWARSLWIFSSWDLILHWAEKKKKALFYEIHFLCHKKLCAKKCCSQLKKCIWSGYSCNRSIWNRHRNSWFLTEQIPDLITAGAAVCFTEVSVCCGLSGGCMPPPCGSNKCW